jgi:hypothetical protein
MSSIGAQDWQRAWARARARGCSLSGNNAKPGSSVVERVRRVAVHSLARLEGVWTTTPDGAGTQKPSRRRG